MLRPKRQTPVRKVAPDPTAGNPLWCLQEQFIAWTLAIGLADQTAKIRRVAVGYFIRWCDSQSIREPAQITRTALEAYQGFLSTHRKRDGNPLEQSTCVTRLNPLKAFCKWLTRSNYLGKDPSIELILPKLARRLPHRVPGISEVSRVIQSPDTWTPAGIRDRAILETLYSTAVRRMELARLKVHDVRLDARELIVRSGKGGRDRIVPLGPRAADWLERYLAQVRPSLIHDIDRPELFLTDYGDAFEKNRLGDLVRRYVDRARVPGRGACHLFRHACATHMLENGADIRFIQALLGHSDLSTTQIYTHVSIGRLKEIHAATHPASFECRPSETR